MSHVTLVSVARVVRWICRVGLAFLATTLLGSCNVSGYMRVPIDPSVGWRRPVLEVYVHYGEPSSKSKIENDISQLRVNLELADVGLNVQTYLATDIPREVESRFDQASVFGFLESRNYLAQEDTRVLHVVYVEHISWEKGDLSGLHVTRNGREFILVNLTAPETTLSHEVGHALGLDHIDNPNNIMCSCERTNPSFSRYQDWVMLNNAWDRVQES